MNKLIKRSTQGQNIVKRASGVARATTGASFEPLATFRMVLSRAFLDHTSGLGKHQRHSVRPSSPLIR